MPRKTRAPCSDFPTSKPVWIPMSGGSAGVIADASIDNTSPSSIRPQRSIPTLLVLRGRAAGIDDLDAAVLRFLDPIGGRHQQVALALGHDLDLGRRNTILLEL